MSSRCRGALRHAELRIAEQRPPEELVHRVPGSGHSRGGRTRASVTRRYRIMGPVVMTRASKPPRPGESPAHAEAPAEAPAAVVTPSPVAISVAIRAAGACLVGFRGRRYPVSLCAGRRDPPVYFRARGVSRGVALGAPFVLGRLGGILGLRGGTGVTTPHGDGSASAGGGHRRADPEQQAPVQQPPDAGRASCRSA